MPPPRPNQPASGLSRSQLYLQSLHEDEDCRRHHEIEMAFHRRRDGYRELMADKCRGAIDDERPVHPHFLGPKNPTEDVNP